ncbi:MAG: beta-lactamase regulating signal transducer with metallopeptidase domain [Verrucomicrobiales bacterium]|jgi:beta-lactamase regulating signal transducer with metallopeptidase domain
MGLPDISQTQSLLSEWLIRSALISMLAFAGVKMLKRGTSIARCRFLFGSLLLLLLLPLSLLFLKVEVAIPLGDLTASKFSQGSPQGNVLPLITMVWMTGVCVWGGLLVTGLWRLKQRLRQAEDVNKEADWKRMLEECCAALGLRKLPRLVMTKEHTMPCAVGVLRPTVVLPATAREWGPERRRMVLLHELGHLKRGDLWLQWVSLVVRGVYWFNPLVKSLHQSLLVHREEACDALVVASGARPNAYARHLLEIASTHSHASALSPALAMAGRKAQGAGTLEQRIVRLLKRNTDDHPLRLRWLVATLTTVVCVVALALVFVVPSLTSGQELGTAPWSPEEVELRWDANPFPTE